MLFLRVPRSAGEYVYVWGRSYCRKWFQEEEAQWLRTLYSIPTSFLSGPGISPKSIFLKRFSFLRRSADQCPKRQMTVPVPLTHLTAD